MFGVDILVFEPGCSEPYPETYPEPYPERSRRGAEGASKGILVHFLILVYPPIPTILVQIPGV